jgi:hypothetical protein
LLTSKLADPALRKRLWDGGLQAVRASDDPMIRFALKLDEPGRTIRKQYEERVEGPVDRAEERIARARFAGLRYERLSGRNVLVAPVVRKNHRLE